METRAAELESGIAFPSRSFRLQGTSMEAARLYQEQSNYPHRDDAIYKFRPLSVRKILAFDGQDDGRLSVKPNAEAKSPDSWDGAISTYEYLPGG